jgi:hypothetical protein
MYRALEQAKVSSSEIDRKARRFEIQLIDVLCDSADPQGTIGRQSRAALQRLQVASTGAGSAWYAFASLPVLRSNTSHGSRR